MPALVKQGADVNGHKTHGSFRASTVGGDRARSRARLATPPAAAADAGEGVPAQRGADSRGASSRLNVVRVLLAHPDTT